jgi:hypothetical protein
LAEFYGRFIVVTGRTIQKCTAQSDVSRIIRGRINFNARHATFRGSASCQFLVCCECTQIHLHHTCDLCIIQLLSYKFVDVLRPSIRRGARSPERFSNRIELHSQLIDVARCERINSGCTYVRMPGCGQRVARRRREWHVYC